MFAIFRKVLGMPLPGQSHPPVRAAQPPVEALKGPIAKPANKQPVKPQE